jgi:hypothetical protein
MDNQELQELVNRIGNQLASQLTDRMMQFDAELIGVLAIILEALFDAKLLERERILQTLDVLQQGQSAEWKGGYSHLLLLSSVLRQIGGDVPSPTGGKPLNVSWLREVIEGGLSKKT